MTKQEILEGNRLIVDFMGIRPIYNSYTGTFQWSDGVFCSIGNILYEKTMNDIVAYVKYRTSWDWIMPVVIKINTMEDFRYSVKILTMDVEIEDSHTLKIVAESSLDFVPDELLNSVYQCVVKFIKWNDYK